MALQFDVSGWCHERDRRWPDYHSQAAHSPWPQTHVFLREDAEVRLWAAVRGVGGGAQQATFRNELEQRLEAAWCACLTADWPGGHRGELSSFTWQPGDALALVTGLHPDDVTEPLIAQALTTPGDSAELSRRLYETLQAGARTRATSEGSERRAHAFVRQAVVVVARQA